MQRRLVAVGLAPAIAALGRLLAAITGPASATAPGLTIHRPPPPPDPPPQPPPPRDISVELRTTTSRCRAPRPPHQLLRHALIGGLADAFESLEADSRCRAIVLAAQGSAFCAGANFANRDATPPQRSQRGVNPLYGEAIRLFACTKPVVAAVHGPAVGGGLGLALVADFRALRRSAYAANFNVSVFTRARCRDVPRWSAA